jgi:flagellar protein FliO/FliZ
MFDSLFGAETPLLLKFILAFIIVLALIVAATWLVRRFGAARLGTSSVRGRQPRLAVIDAASVDGRRRLVLIRRDNVEHLILIGGPTDMVVEQNIVRAVPVAQPRELMPRQPEMAPRGEPRPGQPEPGWAPEPARGARPVEPTWMPEPTARPGRPGHPEPGLRMPPPMDLPPRPLSEPATGMRAGPPSAPGKPGREAEQPVEMRQSPPTADVNLADMAQRLEAALRRPAVRPPEPSDAARPDPARVEPARTETKSKPAAEAARPPAPPSESPRPQKPAAPEAARAATPGAAAPGATAPEPSGQPAPEPAPPAEASGETKPAPGKSVLDTLEEEMANLLGRTSSKP